ncbi:siroheme synthase CysG [Rhodobacteraceae bacterium S2214]|nr:siroheme synthase CysG [Rhodobacteraceae bacterium S2214]
MKTFPMFLTMAGRRVVIVGGGEQAAQKSRLILKTEAEIVVMAPALDEELSALAAAGKLRHDTSPITAAHFEDTALVFVASGCPGIDAAIHAIAKDAGATVNVVDQPALCDAITPSIVDRDPVVVAIGTEGTAPVLARQIKTQMEQALEPRLGDLAALAGRLRDAAAARLAPRARRDLWRWVFNAAPREAHARGAEREAASLIKNAIATGEIDAKGAGSVSLVGAGPGSKDLITLRGVQRLQEADVIFYDRLLEPEILELARRDAERVYVGKAPGCHSWPQEKITQTLISAAKRGQRVVRLKCGDPGVFGRGGEEARALKAHDIDVEIVPGVTAACAAAAAIGESLTDRDEVNTLVLTTGHLQDGYVVPEAVMNMRPGTCVALYMAVGAAADIGAQIEALYGVDQIEITAVAHAQRSSQKVVKSCVRQLSDDLESAGITDTAIVFLRWPDTKQIEQPVVPAAPKLTMVS